jgi:hypothetical protein
MCADVTMAGTSILKMRMWVADDSEGKNFCRQYTTGLGSTIRKIPPRASEDLRPESL